MFSSLSFTVFCYLKKSDWLRKRKQGAQLVKCCLFNGNPKTSNLVQLSKGKAKKSTLPTVLPAHKLAGAKSP